jgi:hypothetical protein
VTCNAMASGDALMPIRPEYRWFYPIDWPQLSAAIRLVAQRADASIAFAHTAAWSFTSGMVVGGTRKRPHGETVGAGRSPCRRIRLSRKMTGSLRPKSCWRPPTSITSNNKKRNLKAYCQCCHMLHDRKEHRRRRWIAFRNKNALGDLFPGTYSNWLEAA